MHSGGALALISQLHQAQELRGHSCTCEWTLGILQRHPRHQHQLQAHSAQQEPAQCFKLSSQIDLAETSLPDMRSFDCGRNTVSAGKMQSSSLAKPASALFKIHARQTREQALKELCLCTYGMGNRQNIYSSKKSCQSSPSA